MQRCTGYWPTQGGFVQSAGQRSSHRGRSASQTRPWNYDIIDMSMYHSHGATASFLLISVATGTSNKLTDVKSLCNEIKHKDHLDIKAKTATFGVFDM